MTKPFEDTSIFQGIVEFSDADGEAYRFERDGGAWKCFVKRGGAYVFERRVKARSNATPRTLHAALA